MINISSFGLKVVITANNTFPDSFTVSAFGDDADPFDNPDFTAADTAYGPNGHFLVWNRPGGIEFTIRVVPTSQDDINLQTLLNANRTGMNKAGSRDVISAVANYPSGQAVSYSKGTIVAGSLNPAVSSSGRIKTRSYTFRFESVTATGATAQEV